MKILICNVGSTSLKYKLFDMNDLKSPTFPATEKVIAFGKAERVGTEKSIFSHKGNEAINIPFPTHKEAIKQMLDSLLSDSISEIGSIFLKYLYTKVFCTIRC